MEITEAEQLCVEIAGLCHDLGKANLIAITIINKHNLRCITGHGPGSHLWERFARTNNVTWEHEKSSLEMLDLIIEGK